MNNDIEFVGDFGDTAEDSGPRDPLQFLAEDGSEISATPAIAPAHSPLPWTLSINEDNGQTCVILDANGQEVVTLWDTQADYETEAATAEFIVRACNSHHDIVATLKEVVAISDRKHDAWDRAKAAINRDTRVTRTQQHP